ncbi:MAG: ElyC/SanA/YdcF family protein [Thermodesulfobacteriota bacterium]
MFWLKKVIGPSLLPVSLFLEVMLLGLALIWLTSRRRAGRAIVSLGFVGLTLMGYGAFSDMLLRPLESEYAPLQSLDAASQVRWIVVLGGGAVADPKLPVTSQLSHSSIVRLVEGIRLQRMLPGSRMILSGGGQFDSRPSADVMAQFAKIMGLSEEEILLERTSKDTADEARLIKEIVGQERFVLVTSASHMRRSMALFERLGMRPIPAPTGHLVRDKVGGKTNPGSFFPNADGLLKAQTALYEYLGIGWSKIMGQI